MQLVKGSDCAPGRRRDHLAVGWASAAGRKEGAPKECQDTFVYVPNVGGALGVHLVAVLDGHGVNGGDVSAYARDEFVKEMASRIRAWPEDAHKRSADGVADLVSETLTTAAVEAERGLFSTRINATLSGTTLIAILLVGVNMFVACVGDSRAVAVLRDGSLRSLARFSSRRQIRQAAGSVPIESEVAPARRLADAEGDVEEDDSGLFANPFDDVVDVDAIAKNRPDVAAKVAEAASGRDVRADAASVASGLRPASASSLYASRSQIIDIASRAPAESLAPARATRVHAIALSEDQVPTVPAERRRIEQCGGKIHASVPARVRVRSRARPPSNAPLRVWSPYVGGELPGLAMTRSIGDEIASEVGVHSAPVVSRSRWDARHVCVILASDGVYDVLGNDEVANIAQAAYVTASEASEACCAAAAAVVVAARVRWEARARIAGSIDDVTAVAVMIGRKRAARGWSSRADGSWKAPGPRRSRGAVLLRSACCCWGPSPAIGPVGADSVTSEGSLSDRSAADDLDAEGEASGGGGGSASPLPTAALAEAPAVASGAR